MMAYILYVIVTLGLISYNSVLTQNTIDPEVSQTCASNNGLCGREIQQMYHIITHLKEKINALEVKEDVMQGKINALETNLTLSNSKIDELSDVNSAFEGNLYCFITQCCSLFFKYICTGPSNWFRNEMTQITNLKNKIYPLEAKMHRKTIPLIHRLKFLLLTT